MSFNLRPASCLFSSCEVICYMKVCLYKVSYFEMICSMNFFLVSVSIWRQSNPKFASIATATEVPHPFLGPNIKVNEQLSVNVCCLISYSMHGR